MVVANDERIVYVEDKGSKSWVLRAVACWSRRSIRWRTSLCVVEESKSRGQMDLCLGPGISRPTVRSVAFWNAVYGSGCIPGPSSNVNVSCECSSADFSNSRELSVHVTQGMNSCVVSFGCVPARSSGRRCERLRPCWRVPPVNVMSRPSSSVTLSTPHYVAGGTPLFSSPLLFVPP